jgi:hypothetical protein
VSDTAFLTPRGRPRPPRGPNESVSTHSVAQREIGILLQSKQRQHRTSHAPKDMLALRMWAHVLVGEARVSPERDAPVASPGQQHLHQPAVYAPYYGGSSTERLVIYCEPISVNAAQATHCATYCTPGVYPGGGRPLTRAQGTTCLEVSGRTLLTEGFHHVTFAEV